MAKRAIRKTQTVEEQLLDQAHRLTRFREGRYVMHAKMSQLARHHQQDSYKREAAVSFRKFKTKEMGELYKLGNNDIICIYGDDAIGEMDRTAKSLSRVFRSDPLVQRAEAGHDDLFCDFYALDEDYDEFIEMVESLTKEWRAPGSKPTPMSAAPPAPPAAGPKVKMSKSVRMVEISAPEDPRAALRPVTLEDAGKIEAACKTIDYEALIEHRSVFLLHANDAPRPVMSRREIRPSRIQELILPNCDLSADPWLLHYLGDSFARLLLHGLTQSWDPNFDVLMIPVTTGSTKTETFRLFSSKLDKSLRERIVLEFSAFDCLADVSAFIALADQLKGAGYSLCLGSMSPATFGVFNPSLCKANFVKLDWPAVNRSGLTAELSEAARRHIADSDKARLILGKCSSAKAVDFGKSMGITLFEGRHIDSLAGQ